MKRGAVLLTVIVAGVLGRGLSAHAETVVLDRSGTVELGRLGGPHETEFAWRAPHFVRQVRRELTALLCAGATSACPALLAGDRVVFSTLDWPMQQAAERLLRAAVFRDHGAFSIHNGALGALDYRTGDVLAWVGSADFDAPASPGLQPQFDVLSQGWRQPGSAFKPFAYLAGLETGVLTAASRLNDVVTEFEPGYVPRNADGKTHGPLLLRDALRNSLNIPAVEATTRIGATTISEVAARFGLAGKPDAPEAGLAAALGVTELLPADVLSAYGALANEGTLTQRRFILKIAEPGRPGLAPAPVRRRVCSAEVAFLVTSLITSAQVPQGAERTGWAVRARDGSRPVALKSGTSNGARDMSAYGYLAPPTVASLPAVAVGVWMGNADGSPAGDTRAAETAVPLWRAFVSEVSRDWPVRAFGSPPEGVVKATVDAETGLAPTAQTRKLRDEWFLRGTEPRSGAGELLAAPTK